MAPFWKRRDTAARAAYTRTSGDLLVNDDGPSGMPFVTWIGVDSGGLASPIGPNGPWSSASAAALPIVTRATSLITAPLTAGPFRVVDEQAPGRTVPAPRWITDPMLLRPDDRFGPSVLPATKKLGRAAFWTDWIRSAVWFGTGAFIAAEDAQGAPVPGTMRLLNPLLLFTKRDAANALCWCVGSDAEPVMFDRDGRITLGATRYRLFVLRNPHATVDDEGHCPGVFEMHPQTFKLSRQIETYTSGTFRSGIPAGYLKANQPHLSQQAADDLKAGWLKNHGGDRRSIAVLNATTEFVPLNLSPVDAALQQVTQLNVADAAMAFGLDPATLGATLGNSGTYSNIRDAWENHRDFGLSQWITAVEDVLGALLPAGLAVRVDLDQFANPTPAERYAAYKTAVDAGFLTVAEVREREGLPPLPAAEEPGVEEDDPPEEPELDPAARRLHIAQEATR